MSSQWYGTMSGSSSNLTFVPPAEKKERPETPSGLIVTRAVETMGGWRGQVLVDKTIVFESGAAHADGEDAIKEANARVVDVIKALFASPTT